LPRNSPLSPVPIRLAARARGAVPIAEIDPKTLADWLKTAPARLKRWIRAMNFAAEAGAVLALPGPDGRIVRVLFAQANESSPWDYAQLPAKLPPGTYRLENEPENSDADAAALGWALAAYHFARYRGEKKKPGAVVLVWPKAADRAAVTRAVEATYLVRDLVNAPANDLGPRELAQAARALARRHGARMTEIVGEALLKKGYGRMTEQEKQFCLLVLVSWRFAQSLRQLQLIAAHN